jgi:formylglycine-generating enzyme required for sulfatase activity
MDNRKGIELVKAACETVIKEDRLGAVMRRAILATGRGDIDAAIELLKAAADENQTHVDPAVMVGVLLLTEKSHRVPAMSYFNKVITQDPNNALALWYLAGDKLRCGNATEAVTLLNAAAECEPPDSYAVLTLAWVLAVLGNLNEANALIRSRLLTSQGRLVCRTLELMLESQEIDFSEELLSYLFGKLPSCVIDLGCIAHSRGHDQRLLNVMLNTPGSDLIAADMPQYNSGCIHLANPALDLYKHRYGERVAKHYPRSFLQEILVPEIKRIFRRNKMQKQRTTQGPGQVPVDMVPVPAGEYTIGFNAPSLKHPERRLLVPAFLIDKYPVTNRQWQEFQPNHAFPKELENGPVTNVDFVQATLYARWKGKRLPTEIEWEAAARGPEGSRFPWGQMPDPGRANCAESKRRRTTPVTQYPRGRATCGAIDMLGNAMEWVDDWGPPDGGRLVNRVTKGGGFSARATDLACWLRNCYPVLAKGSNIGFRCAKDI